MEFLAKVKKTATDNFLRQAF